MHISIIHLETTEDKLTIADIVLPEGVVFADNEEDLTLVVANVYEPGALQAANEASGGDAEDVVAEEPAEGDAAPADGDAKDTPKSE